MTFYTILYYTLLCTILYYILHWSSLHSLSSVRLQRPARIAVASWRFVCPGFGNLGVGSVGSLSDLEKTRTTQVW